MRAGFGVRGLEMMFRVSGSEGHADVLSKDQNWGSGLRVGKVTLILAPHPRRSTQFALAFPCTGLPRS